MEYDGTRRPGNNHRKDSALADVGPLFIEAGPTTDLEDLTTTTPAPVFMAHLEQAGDGDWVEPSDELTGTAVFDATGDKSAMPPWDELVRQHSDARLPAGLPADRQPARRRGPHPGGVRPGLPLAVRPTPRAPSRAGCTASPPTSSSTRSAASSGIRFDALPDDCRPAAQPSPRPRAVYHDARFDDDVQRALDALPAGLPRRRGALRHRGPVLRGDRARPWASSSARSAAASTADARPCVTTWPPMGTPIRTTRPDPLDLHGCRTGPVGLHSK